MEDKIRRYAEEIALIIAVTEEIQDSSESDYTKKQALINAYNNIVELVGGGTE